MDAERSMFLTRPPEDYASLPLKERMRSARSFVTAAVAASTDGDPKPEGDLGTA